MAFEFNDAGIVTFTLSDGLYSLSDINERLAELFVNSGRAADFMVFVGDEATQKTSLQINATGVTIDWTNATIGGIL